MTRNSCMWLPWREELSHLPCIWPMQFLCANHPGHIPYRQHELQDIHHFRVQGGPVERVSWLSNNMHIVYWNSLCSLINNPGEDMHTVTICLAIKPTLQTCNAHGAMLPSHARTFVEVDWGGLCACAWCHSTFMHTTTLYSMLVWLSHIYAIIISESYLVNSFCTPCFLTRSKSISQCWFDLSVFPLFYMCSLSIVNPAYSLKAIARAEPTILHCIPLAQLIFSSVGLLFSFLLSSFSVFCMLECHRFDLHSSPCHWAT